MNLTHEQVMDIVEKLEEIRDKKGAFDRNQLIHAENVIESNSKHASEILKILGGFKK